jgi:DNA primase catalytic core
MQVTKEGIERIKRANNLAELLAERGIAIQKKGTTLVASCPFHKEKTPSFVLTPSKGLFHCFGCGVSGDVIGFVCRYDCISFADALWKLSRRAGLDLSKLMEPALKALKQLESSCLPPDARRESSRPAPSPEVLAKVVEHYHKTFCARGDAQEYLEKRGFTDPSLFRDFHIGYADGSLLGLVPKKGELREQLLSLGVLTERGRELLGGCIVVPIPDPLTGKWTSLYGRGLRTDRHCYLPGPFRGIVNYQAAKLSSEIVLTESIFDAFSFQQAGIRNVIPIYGTNGFTAEHLDLLKRESIRSVVLALDSDEAGQRAAKALKGKITSAGIDVRAVTFPEGIKDANDLLISRNGDAGDVFRKLLGEAPRSSTKETASEIIREDGELVFRRGELAYRLRVYPAVMGRLRATVKLERGSRFHIDTLDLYSSRSRTEFSRRVSKALDLDEGSIESDLLKLLVEAEKVSNEEPKETSKPPELTSSEKGEAMAFLRQKALLDQVAEDIDALGYVGEETNKRLLYLVAVSRKLEDPLSAVILSQSGAGKSGLTEVIEELTPPEDVVFLTRLTPQSLYYTAPGFLDRKLIIIEERHGSIEADYSIRVLQSRKKLIAAAPIKDPLTGNMRTKVFSVEARAAFIEATTESSVNHENATRCFELQMDESAEQTARIHERQRLMKTERGLHLREKAEAIARKHWNAQRLLEPLPVVIPFADQLTFPSHWMRTRRDHARFLNLIEVSAFLHQFQRERQKGAIVASADDYAVAYRLSREVLSETLSDVRKPLREAYERIKAVSVKAGGPLSRRDIREALNVPDSTVRRWLSELVEYEHLVVLQPERARQGRAVRYQLHEQEPKLSELQGLLSPDELRSVLGNFATSPRGATGRVAGVSR